LNFTFVGSNLSPNELNAKFHINKENRNNTLEIISQPASEEPHAYILSLNFNYEYNKDSETITGSGLINRKADLFNYTLVYAHPDYEVLNLVEVKMSYKDHILNERYDAIDKFLMKTFLQNNFFQGLSENVSPLIKQSLDEIVVFIEDTKNFVLKRKEPKKNFIISLRESLAFEFDSEDGVISFMEGSIDGERILADEDAALPPIGETSKKDIKVDQVFLHK